LDPKHQALRWFVTAQSGDSAECAEKALDAGFRPDWLRTYSHPQRCFVDTAEYLLGAVALAHLDRTGVCPGIVVLRQWLTDAQRRGAVPGDYVGQASAILDRLPGLPLSLGDVEPIVGALREQYQLGNLYAGLHTTVEQLKVAPPEEIARELRRVADSVEETAQTSSAVYSLADVADARWEEYKAAELNPERARGVLLGWLAFDERNNGIRPGEVLVVAANTSVGKSAFQVRSALNAWRLGRRNVMLVNKEMSARVQHQRMEAMELCSLLRERPDVERLVTRIEMGTLGEDMKELYHQLLESYRQNPAQFWIVPPDAYRDLGDLNSLVGRYKRKWGLDLVCADNLNFQRAPGARADRHDLVLGDTIGYLHDIAVRHNVAIITDVQSPRQVAIKREITKEEAVGYSQIIIHTADDLIRLFRIDEHFLEAQVLKARSGESNYSFQLYFDPRNMHMEYVADNGGGW